MRKRILSLSLAVCMLCLLTMTSCAAAEVPAAGNGPGHEAESLATQTTGFTDVPQDAWYADGVAYCQAHGIMEGTGTAAFSPEGEVTRAMLAAVLYRMSGSPAVSAPSGFTDAEAGAWYADAVAWTAETGVMAGYGNGVFGVNAPATREQAVTILWRYAGEPAGGAEAAFSDAGSISDWARSAARWADAAGILDGMTADRRFAPQANVKRGELAAMLYRYLSGGQGAGPSVKDLVISVGDKEFAVELEESASTRALRERLPFTMTMGELNGNEKFCYLADPLPNAPERPGTIQAGDLMLYGPDCLVLFYESFASSYSYTRLGRVADPEGLADALGSGDVEVTFQLRGQEETPGVTADQRILVAYFSATGTTKALAEYAADILGADLYEIVPEVPYTDDDLDYNNNSSRANQEQSSATARPAISGGVSNMEDYDVVLLGYPIWHGQAPKVISTFLEGYDFTGKTIVPFCTSHSSGIGSSDTNLHALAPVADWCSGRRFAGGAAREAMEEWIGGLDLQTNAVPAFDFETKTVTLNSGYAMPINGLGTYSLTGETCVSSVSAALERGVRLIDTAHIYGNEEEVGQAVRESGIPRKEIFVITKLYPNQFADADAAIDEALETLDIGYIDLMLLHHPGTGDVEAYRAMERAVATGKVRSIGLSNWYVEELEEFMPQVTIPPALVQNEIHPYYQENDVIPYIQSLGIVVQGWYPLGGRGHTAELLGDEVISEIAAAHGKSSAQVILRWNLQKGVVVIPGSSNPDHIQENTELYDFELTQAEMTRINDLDRGEKHDWY